MSVDYEYTVMVVRKLLGHIIDLKLLYNGLSDKSYIEIDNELKETEYLCSVYKA